MPLTAKRHSEIIQQHWPLLWLLPTQRRMQVLEEIIADHEQEDDLRQVGDAVAEDAPLLPAKELDFANLEF